LFQVERIKFKYQESQPSGILKGLDSAELLCVPDDIKPITYGNFLSYPGVLLALTFSTGESRSIEKAAMTFFAARMFQLSLTLLVLFRFVQLAIRSFGESKRWSFGTLTTLAIVSTPIFLQQASAVSGDSMVNALAIVLVTLILFWSFVGLPDVLSLTFVGLSAASTKPIVLPAIAATFLVLLLKNSLFLHKGHRIRFSNTLFELSSLRLEQRILLFGLFALSIFALFVGMTSSAALSASLTGVADPVGQRNFILQNSIKAGAAIWEGSIRHLNFSHFLGNLGWLDTPLLGNLFDCYLVLFSVAVFVDVVMSLMTGFPRSEIDTWFSVRRFILASVFVAGALSSNSLTAFALYLTWTPVGAEFVNGLQPRYFLLSFMLVLVSPSILFGNTREVEEKADSGQQWVWNISSVLNLVMCLALFFLGAKIVSEIAFTLAKRYW
jgi:uncharacterized membrane protein